MWWMVSGGGMMTNKGSKATSLTAFSIIEELEGTGAIYFAKHAITAKKAFANEHNDGDLGGITCRRAAWADDYADKPLPANLMVEHGWWFECVECGNRIELQNFEDEGRDISAIVGTQHSLVFCDAICAEQYTAKKRACRVVEDDAIAFLRTKVLDRLPGVEFVTGNGIEHAYARWKNGRPVLHQAVISFNFPGQKIGPASLRMDDVDSKWLALPTFHCCSGDRDAFEAFAAECIV